MCLLARRSGCWIEAVICFGSLMNSEYSLQSGIPSSTRLCSPSS